MQLGVAELIEAANCKTLHHLHSHQIHGFNSIRDIVITIP
jgi:hypothetical protein